MSWINLLTGVPQAVATYLTRRAELKAQAHQNEIDLLKAQGERQVALASQGLTADANWEMEFARQASSSWKDEYTLLVVSLPAILAFLPQGAPIVKRGLDAISSAPVWYQILLCSIFFATYGIRYWRRTQSDTP